MTQTFLSTSPDPQTTATFCTPEILYIIRRNCYTSQCDPDSSFPLWHQLINLHNYFRFILKTGLYTSQVSGSQGYHLPKKS